MTWKFKSSYDEDENIDWSIIRNGPIVKYYSKEILKNDIKELTKIGYEIIELSTKNWNEENYHKKIKESLDFNDYYGENINAFEDCLNEKFNIKYKGLLLVFSEFDSFYLKNKEHSDSLLNSLFRVSWTWLLANHKLIIFLQSNNPNLNISEVKGFTPDWNSEEWFDEKRINKN